MAIILLPAWRAQCKVRATLAYNWECVLLKLVSRVDEDLGLIKELCLIAFSNRLDS